MFLVVSTGRAAEYDGAGAFRIRRFPNPALFEDFKPALNKLRERKLNVFLVPCKNDAGQRDGILVLGKVE